MVEKEFKGFEVDDPIIKEKTRLMCLLRKKKSSPEIEIIEPNWDGIANAIDSFTQLYKVAPNKELVDEAFKKMFLPDPIIHMADAGTSVNF